MNSSRRELLDKCKDDVIRLDRHVRVKQKISFLTSDADEVAAFKAIGWKESRLARWRVCYKYKSALRSRILLRIFLQMQFARLLASLSSTIDDRLLHSSDWTECWKLLEKRRR